MKYIFILASVLLVWVVSSSKQHEESIQNQYSQLITDHTRSKMAKQYKVNDIPQNLQMRKIVDQPFPIDNEEWIQPSKIFQDPLVSNEYVAGISELPDFGEYLNTIKQKLIKGHLLKKEEKQYYYQQRYRFAKLGKKQYIKYDWINQKFDD